MRHLFVGLLLAAATIAASAQECPVKVFSISAVPNSTLFSIEYKNLTDKKIKGAKFDATFYDATGGVWGVMDTFIDSGQVKVGKTRYIQWRMSRTYDAELRGGAEVWPVRILFEDGSVWENDASRMCLGSDWRRGKGRTMASLSKSTEQ
jgi:hypothetical protein